jgi:hypothetical protein
MARLVTEYERLDAESRLVAVRLGALLLRQRARWTELFGSNDAALIMVAIAVIRSERLLRQPLDRDSKTLSVHLPKEALGRCNVRSIADAIGMNRETVRRRVEELVRIGMLEREAGELRFVRGFTQRPAFREVVGYIFEDVRSTVNDFLHSHVLRVCDGNSDFSEQA